ncbi:hypothetical protein [Salinigranum salinum]|uniref:hypothetical protein n=1 Tax=Salinigranum salinum TaxID=1364937 RepID=UPI00186464F3|nr:hypothetical protein [Salinigranum salinum]
MEVTDIAVTSVSTESWGEFVEFPLADRLGAGTERNEEMPAYFEYEAVSGGEGR